MYETAFNNSNAIVCKSSQKISAVIVDGVFYKRYHYRGFFHSLCHIFSTGRTQRVQRSAAQLRQAGVPTPEVLEVLQVKKFGFFPLYEVLLTRALASGETVLTHAPQAFYHRDRSNSIDLLCQLLTAIHQSGVVHGDMNMRNIYQTTDSCGIPALGVIDLDGAKVFAAVPRYWRSRELARMISSFLKSAKSSEYETVSRQFAQSYARLSSIDLYTPQLVNRVQYLAKRVRK